MEQKGDKLYLDDEEQLLTGLSSPLSVDEIDILKLTEENLRLEDELFKIQYADDDDVTSTERGFIVAAGNRLHKRKRVTEAVIKFWMGESE